MVVAAPLFMTVRISSETKNPNKGLDITGFDVAPWCWLQWTLLLASYSDTRKIVGDLGGFSMFSWVFSVYLLAEAVTIPIMGNLQVYENRYCLLVPSFLISSATSGHPGTTSLICSRITGDSQEPGSIMATVNQLPETFIPSTNVPKCRAGCPVLGNGSNHRPLHWASVEYASWRWIFWSTCQSVLSILLIVIFFKTHIKNSRIRLIMEGAIMMLLRNCSHLYSDGRWTILALVLIEGFGHDYAFYSINFDPILIETKSPEPILPNWVWRNKILTGTNLSMICMGTILLGPVCMYCFRSRFWVWGAIACVALFCKFDIGWPIASWYSGKLYKKWISNTTAILGSHFNYDFIASFFYSI